MKETQMIMGMTIVVEVVDMNVSEKDIEEILNFFKKVDQRFSTYKKNSEICKIQRGEISPQKYSKGTKEIFALAEKTKKETNGYFDIYQNGRLDPSGIVKGWAIQKAAEILWKKGFKNFYVNAGGDIQTSGKNNKGELWKVGLKNPFNDKEIIKVIRLSGQGVATSGTYIRGQHIYNPHNFGEKLTDIVSLSVIGENILDADKFATAAFAMGRQGINFLESLSGFEGCMIDSKGIATYTSGFGKYL